ncbi:MAG: diguanylate cyclase, partial [Asticcacaulis sp.]|nr:diguanylate cyclase [Asticcacaulis sp.]
MEVSHEARVLFALVAVAGAGTLIAIIFLLNSSLATIAAKTDETSRVKANEMVQASVEALLNYMTGIAGDNAGRPDAAAHLYGPQVDAAWADRTWGYRAHDHQIYDGAFIIDQNRHILWGRFRGQVFSGRDAAALGGGFTGLLDLYGRDLEGRRPAVSGLTRSGAGAGVVSVALVRPPAGMDGERRYLVLTRHFTPHLVQGLGGAFRLDGLRLTSVTDPTKPYFEMVDASHHAIGRLTWTPRLAGAAMADAAAPRIRQVSWLVAGLIVMFGGVSAYSLTKLARSEKDARNFALTDNLSGLPNRRAMFERLRKYAEKRRMAHKAVVFIDLDGFKDVNDIYGHNTGDKLIMICAAALKQYLPRTGMLARMGGDEFAMLVGGSDGVARCQAFAEQALAFLTAPIRIGERTVQIGASIGIAAADLKDVGSQELIRRADMAMYHSKSTGKGRITHYDA